MKSVTSSKLQNNLDQLLDEILNTGKPLEIERNGKRLIISPVETVDKLQKLIYRPQAIIGDPDDLVQISWEQETNLDLRLFSTLCDNFCLWNREMLIGQHF
ncbi:type II toxin-antitoxin system Phd/YefM family antitoxin [Microcystis aeruginosa]|jgi:virulence-associated protein VagC|uniref:type II toxin-antitoxin system Phd/YefM family antitoxin n=1 Tax=Microcystis aeruginosa TaxID=1126 RepID=UPI001D13B20D|nr:type II toxin-antitoxin system Phd/YefM family antitoxin [Microcystis aeruginosa]MCZ8128101.1 type II toxin-antitoxin system Phd/YefM family antitoxin [Microcystis sp. LE19-114.1B]